MLARQKQILSGCSLVGFSQPKPASQQYFPLTINQHQPVQTSPETNQWTGRDVSVFCFPVNLKHLLPFTHCSSPKKILLSLTFQGSSSVSMKMLPRKPCRLHWKGQSAVSLLSKHTMGTGLGIMVVLCSLCQAWYLLQLYSDMFNLLTFTSLHHLGVHSYD